MSFSSPIAHLLMYFLRLQVRNLSPIFAFASKVWNSLHRERDDLCNLVIFQYTICAAVGAPNLKLEAADLLLGVGNARNARKVLLLPLLIDTSTIFCSRGKLFRFTKCKNADWINSWCSLLAFLYIDLGLVRAWKTLYIKRRVFDSP